MIEALQDMERKCQQRRLALIVDDEPTSREVLRKMLESIGWECVEAANCDEAEQAAESGQPFDLGFFDYRMPGRDGIVCATALSHRLPKMRRVLWTGYPQDLINLDLNKMGFVTLLCKPVMIEDLRKLVRQFNL